MSLVYNNRPHPAAPVIEAVTPLRDLASVDLHVQEVQLVELRREDRAIGGTSSGACRSADCRFPTRQDGNDHLADGGGFDIPPPCQRLHQPQPTAIQVSRASSPINLR
jgi:hypothetical protein